MTFVRYLWLASTGFRTYLNFLDLSLRRTLAYWAFLSGILASLTVWNLYAWFSLGFPVIMKEVEAHLPAFEMREGKAYSQLPQPYFSNTNQFPIIQDMEGTIKNPEKMFPQGMMIKKNELVFWVEGVPPKTMPWSPTLPDGKVDSTYLKDLRDKTVKAWPIFLFVAWLGIILLGLVQALLFTALAGILEKSMVPSFTFQQLFNLAIFSLTPGSLIVAIYSTMGFSEFRKELIYFGCYCFFLIMASGACRDALRTNEEGSSADDE